MNGLLKVVAVFLLVLSIVIGCLFFMFSQLPQPVKVATKAFTAVYQSTEAPKSKRFLISDGRGKLRFDSESAPNQIVITDYLQRKTYIVDKKEGSYTAYDLVKEGLADETAYVVPPYVQLLFLGQGRKNGYECRHYIALFFFCFAGYIEDWYSPELGCSVEFSPYLGFKSNGHATLLKYSAGEPDAQMFDLSRFKQTADYSHK